MMEEKLDQARCAYKAKLAKRVIELSELIARARTEAVALEAAQRLAHKIYGSAGTFGFAAVGAAARAIDRGLLRIREGESASPELWRELEAALERAREELVVIS